MISYSTLMDRVQEVGAVTEQIDWWAVHYEDLDERFVCPICRTALVEPYSTDCGHTFCHDCLTATFRVSDVCEAPAVCPLDRTSLKSCPQPATFVVKQLLDELKVQCPNWERGCRFSDKRWLLDSHFHTDCMFVHVRCECDKEVERRALGQCPHEDIIEVAQEEGTKASTSEEETTGVSTTEVNTDEESKLENAEANAEMQTECTGTRMRSIETRLNSMEIENRALKRQLEGLQRRKGATAAVLDAEILAEYDRVLQSVRETRADQAAQQQAMAGMTAENVRLASDVSHLMGMVDSLRRQLFHFTQPRRFEDDKERNDRKQKL